MFRNILVATDGTELSAKATDAALELASMSQAHLFVLSVALKLLPAATEFEIAMHPQDLQKLEDQALARSRATVDQVVEQARSQGVAATGLCLSANLVADTIIEQAKQNDCQLIVMASHGRKGWARLLMGSETLDVLTHSKISTLVVR
jgi:nucleotide-binding universal stress UspA family protein